MGPDAMILVFRMLSFKPAFSLSSFTFNNEYKYKDAFNQAQANAKRDGLGLWTTCAE